MQFPSVNDLKQWLAQAVRDPKTASQPVADTPSEQRSLRPGECRVGRQIVDTRGSDSFRASAAAAGHSGKPGWLRAVEKDFDDIAKDLGF